MSALDHIVFRTAENMREVADTSAQLTVMSPAYFEDEAYEKRLLGNIFKECERITKRNGVVASAFTDYKRRGGTYPKHLAVCNAAQQNGFEVFDHRAVVWSFNRSLYRKGYYHVYVFQRTGECCWRAHHNRYAPYNYQPWVLTASQAVGNFQDALDPEIYQMLTEKFTRKKDLVVLPFAGSGTGVIMALRLGRKAIGYEIDRRRRELVCIREEQIATRACFSATSPIELFRTGAILQPTLVPAAEKHKLKPR